MEYHCYCIRETLWFMTQINQSLLLLSNLQYWGNYISHGAFVVILLLLPLQKEPKFTFYQQLRRYFENVPRRQQQQLPSKLSTRVHKWLSIWHERRNPAVLSLGTKKVVKDRRTRKKELQYEMPLSWVPREWKPHFQFQKLHWIWIRLLFV